jgi:hypothetical protein
MSRWQPLELDAYLAAAAAVAALDPAVVEKLWAAFLGRG